MREAENCYFKVIRRLCVSTHNSSQAYEVYDVTLLKRDTPSTWQR